MQERTAFRLAMLANGFQPVLTNCKRAIETGWPTRIVDEAEVKSWDRSALASTGLKPMDWFHPASAHRQLSAAGAQRNTSV